ncbi:MAG TPA: amidohydrolase family protein [Steroidobacteraceae bacterium]|nr:amidohydrolase family protein [Steroidobacteraceae bacterium]
MRLTRRARRATLGGVAAVCAAAALAAQHDRAGVMRVTVHEGTEIAVALSPDRSTMVIDLQGVLFGLPVRGGAAHALTDALYDAHQPCWYADGSRIAFQSDRDGHWRIWSVRPDGSDPKVLTPGPFEAREPACAPDGKHVAFTSDRSGNFDIWELTLADGTLRQVTHAPSGESRASYSPDGREIAYVSDREKAAGIYATASDGAERLVARTEVESGGMTVPVGTPTWTPDGKKVLFTLIKDGFAKLMLNDQVVSADEDMHPFRGAWLSADEFLYTADGKIKHRSLATGKTTTVEFSAELSVRRPVYARHPQDLSSTAAQPVLGLLKPVISPDGARVAFAALGNLWLMEIGSKPRAVTAGGPFVVTDPAWSPDGSQLVYSSDREGSLDLWIYDVRSGAHRRLTTAPGAEMRPAWSPDGTRIAFVNAFGSYTMQVQVIELATGRIVTIQPFSFGSGYPSWSADGRSVMVSRLAEYSTSQSYYVGATNQIEVLSADGTGKPRDYTAVANHSIGNRSAADGPVWSPDGRSIAFQMDQALWVMPVSPEGAPAGAPRKLADGIASYISWTGDSSRLLYLDVNELKLIQVADGRIRPVPLELTWRRRIPEGRLVVHAGKLVDGVHQRARSDVDIVVERNRIIAIEPHEAGRKADRVVDASGLTVMPGLMDMHEHLIKEYGSSFGRLLLAYGITTVRSPGNVPSDVIEEREASAAGLRPSPRVFAAGYILDGERSYWEMSAPVANLAQADKEIDRARKLRYDLVKTYVHTSEPVRERLVQGAHEIGIPATSHEIYPAALFGSDSVEHLDGNGSSRGYSTKTSELNKVYDDVVQILSQSHMTITPTISLFTPIEEFAGPAARNDARWLAQPAWVRAPGGGFAMPPPPQQLLTNIRAAILKLHRAGVRIVTGTDSPLTLIGLSTHNELEQAVRAGLTPFEALQTATIVPAELLGERADLGSIEAGKLADLVVVEGDPLADIHNARNVRQVIVNGQVYGPESLPLGPGDGTVH